MNFAAFVEIESIVTTNSLSQFQNPFQVHESENRKRKTIPHELAWSLYLICLSISLFHLLQVYQVHLQSNSNNNPATSIEQFSIKLTFAEYQQLMKYDQKSAATKKIELQ